MDVVGESMSIVLINCSSRSRYVEIDDNGEELKAVNKVRRRRRFVIADEDKDDVNFDKMSPEAQQYIWSSQTHLAFIEKELREVKRKSVAILDAVNEVIVEVLSQPIRPQFVIASIGPSFSLEDAHALIPRRLDSRIPVTACTSQGIIGRDAPTHEFQEMKDKTEKEDFDKIKKNEIHEANGWKASLTAVVVKALSDVLFGISTDLNTSEQKNNDDHFAYVSFRSSNGKVHEYDPFSKMTFDKPRSAEVRPVPSGSGPKSKQDAEKQSRQIKLCTKVPPSSSKRSCYGGSILQLRTGYNDKASQGSACCMVQTLNTSARKIHVHNE
nr:F-box/LRR-repeat protein At5g63520-like isoform X1 [Ipomoea batatas]